MISKDWHFMPLPQNSACAKSCLKDGKGHSDYFWNYSHKMGGKMYITKVSMGVPWTLASNSHTLIYMTVFSYFFWSISMRYRHIHCCQRNLYILFTILANIWRMHLVQNLRSFCLYSKLNLFLKYTELVIIVLGYWQWYSLVLVYCSLFLLKYIFNCC